MGFAFEYMVPLNLILFAMMFAGLFFYDRRARYTGWLSAAYLSGVVAALLDIAQPHSEVAMWNESDLSYYFYWGLGLLLYVAMASRFGRPLPRRTMAALVLFGLGVQPIVGLTHYHHGWQEAVNNALLVVWLLMAAWVVRAGSEGPWHRAVWMLFVAIALSCVLRVVGIYVPGWLRGTDAAVLAEAHNMAQLFLSGISANAAAMALVAMTVTDLVRVYRDEANFDALTGLLNRRGLVAALNERHNHGAASGPGAGLPLLLIDLDHFKRINDQHGHVAGDRVLADVGAVIGSVAGPGRLVARMGGEEFAVVLPQHEAGRADLADALAVRLWLALRETLFPDLPGVRVTASLGVGAISPSEPFDHAYARVDAAMYRAKAEGRDRIVQAAEAA
jgi:diguanylate cyclase (GGDEF)-like protein